MFTSGTLLIGLTETYKNRSGFGHLITEDCVFDWEHPSEEFPNEFDEIGNGYEPADSYGGWYRFSKEFEISTCEQLRDGVNPDRARTRSSRSS